MVSEEKIKEYIVALQYGSRFVQDREKGEVLFYLFNEIEKLKSQFLEEQK